MSKHTSGGTGGNNGAVKTGLGDNVDLDGGVTARVVHGAGVNLGDRHFDCDRSDGKKDQLGDGKKRLRRAAKETGSIWRQNAVTKRREGQSFTDDPKKDRPNGRAELRRRGGHRRLGWSSANVDGAIGHGRHRRSG